MTKYIRKLKSQAIWKKNLLTLNAEEILDKIPSDVFSKCMESDQNKLSIWKVDGDSWDDYGDVIATIVSGSDGPSKTDLVLLDDTILTGIDIENIRGVSQASDTMNDLHYDLYNLTHFKIGQIAKSIGLHLAQDQIWENNKTTKPKDCYFKRFTEKELIKIMRVALTKGIIKKEDLKVRWQTKC